MGRVNANASISFRSRKRGDLPVGLIALARLQPERLRISLLFQVTRFRMRLIGKNVFVVKNGVIYKT
jgi:hypothetical protein